MIGCRSGTSCRRRIMEPDGYPKLPASACERRLTVRHGGPRIGTMVYEPLKSAATRTQCTIQRGRRRSARRAIKLDHLLRQGSQTPAAGRSARHPTLTAAVAGLGYRATLADAPSDFLTPGRYRQDARSAVETTRRSSNGALHIAVISSGGPRWQRHFEEAVRARRDVTRRSERGTISGTAVNVV